MKRLIKLGTIGCMMVIASFGWVINVQAQDPVLTPFVFPPDANPQVLAQRYADDFAAKTEYMLNQGVMHYAETLAADAAINFAHSTEDEALFGNLELKYMPLFHDDWEFFPGATYVLSMPMLAFYNHSGNEAYRLRAYELAGSPRIYNPDEEERESDLSADGMFFVPTIDARFYELDGISKRIDRPADVLSIHLQHLLQPNGLVHHNNKYGDFRVVWGRGMGWACAGLANTLQTLPEDHPERAYLMESYLTMMAALVPYQQESGLWYQLVEMPATFMENGEMLTNWEETSCTGMFAYSMLTGIRMGWLDQATYGPVVEKAWLGLVDMINEDGELTFTCVPTHGHDNAKNYLKTFRQGVGDLHAQAAFLWMAEALTIFNNMASIDVLDASFTAPEEGDELVAGEDVIVEFTATGNSSGFKNVVIYLYDGVSWSKEGTFNKEAEAYTLNIGPLDAGEGYKIRAIVKAKDGERHFETINITVKD